MADSITWNQISGKLFMIQLHYLNLLYFLFMVKPFSICISRQSAVHLSQGKKQNMLDLGPLHQKVSTHIQAIIANPRDNKQHHLLEKRKKRQEQVQKNAERIAGIAIILDKGILSNFKGNHLLDQIKIFKEAGAPNLHVFIFF